jgi:tRNA 5-methylaminomethyl-2-thiouridine biosynthesis bifunctional protein
LDADPLPVALLQADWQAKAGLAGSTLLDTELRTGLDAQFSTDRFGAVLHAWQHSPLRPRWLHYVALLPPDTNAADSGNLKHVLGAAAFDTLDAGLHRMVLADQQVSLTLCVGAPLHMLGELQLRADHILAASDRSHWDRWWLKALARCCRPGTQLHFPDAQGLPQDAMREVGLDWVSAADVPKLPAQRLALYAPRWRNTRQQPQPTALPVGTCAVVGAGLAGAAVARALAERGWLVDVYDQHTEPAQGASGLPAGLVAPLVSADDGARSQLLRRGTRLMLAQAGHYLERGRDWDQTGVLEYRRDRTGETAHATHWHPQAGWIKPASMVRAWLAHPSIRFVPQSVVHRLQRQTTHWQLLNAKAQVLGHADAVVLANAHGCQALLQSSAPALQVDAALAHALVRLQQLHGSVSMGSIGSSASPGSPGKHGDQYAPGARDPDHGQRTDGAQLPPCAIEVPGPRLPSVPVNGRGSYIPWVNGPDGPQWIAGATYENDPTRCADAAQQHQANLDKLLQLLPQCGDALVQAFAQETLVHWHNTRCATWDRLPLVGPVEACNAPSVWMCVGMGSRGLSLASLCAQLLAAQIGGEPWPLEASLARQLQSQRLRKSMQCTL